MSDAILKVRDVTREYVIGGGLFAKPRVLKAVKGPDGNSLVDGRKVTGFTNTEEEAVGLTDVVPFLVENVLITPAVEDLVRAVDAKKVDNILANAERVSGDVASASAELKGAMDKVIAEARHLTGDLGGKASTAQVTQAVCRMLAA